MSLYLNNYVYWIIVNEILTMRKIDLYLIIATTALLIIVILIFFYMKSEGGKCINEPLSYAQDKLNNGAICSCFLAESYTGYNPAVYYCASRCSNNSLNVP